MDTAVGVDAIIYILGIFHEGFVGGWLLLLYSDLISIINSSFALLDRRRRPVVSWYGRWEETQEDCKRSTLLLQSINTTVTSISLIKK